MSELSRRNLLKTLTLATTGSLLSLSLKSVVLAENDNINWGYIGKNGTDTWGSLSPQFQACSMGKNQSPVNLTDAIIAELPQIFINYQSSPLHIINNGHTVQVNYDSGSVMHFRNQTFELLQFHFHAPSEHLMNGKAYDMELHLVHRDKSGLLAVLAVFLQIGLENSVLKSIWQSIPKMSETEKTIEQVTINAQELLPKNQEICQYTGSLTTPPCSEGVTWLVFKNPIELSLAQFEQFTSIVAKNARPTQPLNARLILQSH